MTDIKITNTRSASAPQFTVADLRDLIDGAPDGATVRIDQYRGDQREPGYTTVTVNMTPGGRL